MAAAFDVGHHATELLASIWDQWANSREANLRRYWLSFQRGSQKGVRNDD
jgi:hypothetical protein